jgi:hypothetical protein
MTHNTTRALEHKENSTCYIEEHNCLAPLSQRVIRKGFVEGKHVRVPRYKSERERDAIWNMLATAAESN